MPVEKKIAASRLQEINEGLCGIGSGIVETHFRKSKRFGAAARICSLIRGRNVIQDYNLLVSAGGELGIFADLLEKALEELQDIGYVTLHRGGGEIKKIEERIPLLGSRFEALGEKWLHSRPSEYEKLNVEMLDDLLIAPIRERELVKKYNLATEDMAVIKDVGESAAYLRTYKSPKDGSTIVYSPLYSDENPEKMIDFFDKHKDSDVSKLFKSIRDYQGKPVDQISELVLREAILSGCLPAPSVDSTGGKRHFAFTPLPGVGPLEKSLLEKARAIVACVRYGEHFAGITRIKYPLLILEKLRRNKTIGPHSESFRQYALLVKLGVGRLAKSVHYSGRWVFHLIDTDENLRALDLAIQYLTVGEVTKSDAREQQARQLLLPGVYGSAARTRVELRHIHPVKYSETTINKLNHLIIGGSSGI